MCRRGVRVECHFCHTPSWETQQDVEYGYECLQCQQWNGFTADGDYNSLKPADGAVHSLSPRQSSSRLSGPSSLSAAAASPFLSEARSFCSACQLAQETLLRKLAAWQPTRTRNGDDDDDGDEEEDDEEEAAELAAYRANAERAARLCADCEAMVRVNLRRQDRRIRREWQEEQVAMTTRDAAAVARRSLLRCARLRVEGVSGTPASRVWLALHVVALLLALQLAYTDWSLMHFLESTLAGWRWTIEAVIMAWHAWNARTLASSSTALPLSSQYFHTTRSNFLTDLIWCLACVCTLGVGLESLLLDDDRALKFATIPHRICFGSLALRTLLLAISYTPIAPTGLPPARRAGRFTPTEWLEKEIPEEDEPVTLEAPAPPSPRPTTLPSTSRTPVRRSRSTMRARAATPSGKQRRQESLAVPAHAATTESSIEHLTAMSDSPPMRARSDTPESKEFHHSAWPELDLLGSGEEDDGDDGDVAGGVGGDAMELDEPLEFQPSLLSIGGFTRTTTRTQTDALAQSVWPLHERVRARRMRAATPAHGASSRRANAPRGLEEEDDDADVDLSAVLEAEKEFDVTTAAADVTDSILAPGSLFSSRRTRSAVTDSPAFGATHASKLISSIDLGIGGMRRASHWLSQSIVPTSPISPMAVNAQSPSSPMNGTAAFPTSPVASFGSTSFGASPPSSSFSSPRSPFGASAVFAAHDTTSTPVSLAPQTLNMAADVSQTSPASRTRRPRRRRHLMRRWELVGSLALFAGAYAANALAPSRLTASLYAGLLSFLLAVLLARLCRRGRTRSVVPLEQKACLVILADLTRRAVAQAASIITTPSDDGEVALPPLAVHAAETLRRALADFPTIAAAAARGIAQIAAQHYDLTLVVAILLVLLARRAMRPHAETEEEQ